MELSKSVSAIGLYRYCDLPDSGLFGRFYSAVLNQMQSWGVTPSYVSAEGKGYSGKFTKIGSRTHDKLMKSEFENITVLSIAATPPASDAPAYDSFAAASLSYVKTNQELLACLVVNEAFVAFRSPEFEGLLRSLVELSFWDFGYGFASSVEKQPDFHILGIDNGKLSAEEYQALCTWYAAPGQIRAALLRDVYPYNLLNPTQLDAQVCEGTTLRQFAQSQRGCSLTRLNDDGLHLWQVPDGEVIQLRRALVGSPVLLS